MHKTPSNIIQNPSGLFQTLLRRPSQGLSVTLAQILLLAFLALPSTISVALAQESKPDVKNQTADAPPVRTLQRNTAISFTGDETVEADVSTHSIAVTSGFSGTKIIIFGTVNRPLKIAPDPSVYDVVVAVEGNSVPLITRRKSRVLGMWINIGSLRFDSAPSYYTIASTRPIEEIANESVLERLRIGFEHLALQVEPAQLTKRSLEEILEYKNAVIRLKRKKDLYQKQDHGVNFIGKSLFRSSFDLPANVPVGPLKASIFLFREGKLLAKFTSQVELRREGLQRLLHNLAFNYPLLYGMLVVMLAALAGLTASAIFRNK